MNINEENKQSNIIKEYSPDALIDNQLVDVINPADVKTLDELFRERVRRSSNKVAYTQYSQDEDQWVDFTWADMAALVERWQVALQDEGLQAGDRVAIRYRNGIDWVCFDQAALRLGLVVVPLYTADRPDNVSYVLEHSGASLVAVATEQDWVEINACEEPLANIKRVLVFEGEASGTRDRVKTIASWLPQDGKHLERGMAQASDLASIVYTSGTTGRPKGVMLSHHNMLFAAYATARSVPMRPTDVGLSFLPLSHTLERTVGYYFSVMCGVHIYFNRDIDVLADDIKLVKPTVLIAVPRVFERIHNAVFAAMAEQSGFKQWMFRTAINIGWRKFEFDQGRSAWHPSLVFAPLFDALVGSKLKDRLGGRIRMVASGGAPLPMAVAKTFIGLGIPILQGYGLTETSPSAVSNSLTRNKPDTIGLVLRGVEVKLEENDELWIRGDNVMLGYWNNDEATNDAITQDGWFRTGDCASVDDEGFLKITGRIKEILVLANGEKVPPADIEAAICRAPIIEQAMVIGEQKSFLAGVLVLNEVEWQRLCEEKGWQADQLNSPEVHEHILAIVSRKMKEFPGYAQVRKVHLSIDEWTIESGLITPTLKLKRAKILEAYKSQTDALYEGHGIR